MVSTRNNGQHVPGYYNHLIKPNIQKCKHIPKIKKNKTKKTTLEKQFIELLNYKISKLLIHNRKKATTVIGNIEISKKLAIQLKKKYKIKKTFSKNKYDSIKILKDFKIITERFQNPINSVSINSSFFAMKIKEPKKLIIYKDQHLNPISVNSPSTFTFKFVKNNNNYLIP